MTMIEPDTHTRVPLFFTRAEIGAGYLWLQYSVDPVPEQGRLHGPVRGPRCGVAADDLDVARRDGILHLRFAPLCATADLDLAVCDVEVGVRAGTVTHVSGRMR